MTKTSYFERDVTMSHEGRTFTLTLERQQECERRGNDWHAKGDPSTSLIADVVRTARLVCAGAPESVARELAGLALGITPRQVDAGIEWLENYMRWHDGDSTFEV